MAIGLFQTEICYRKRTTVLGSLWPVFTKKTCTARLDFSFLLCVLMFHGTSVLGTSVQKFHYCLYVLVQLFSRCWGPHGTDMWILLEKPRLLGMVPWYPGASPRTCWLCSLMSLLCVPYPACLWIQQGHPVLGVTHGMCTAAGSGPVAAGSSKFFLLSGLPKRWRGGDAATGRLHTICKTTCSSRCGFEFLEAGEGTKPTLPWPGWLLLAVGYSV